MYLSLTDLLRIAGNVFHHSIGPATALSIIRSKYCASLHGRGTCPIAHGGGCPQCAGYIRRMFNLGQARDAMALLTYHARDLAAAANEDFRARQEKAPQRPLPPEGADGKASANPLADYLRMLSDLR
jgi:hypothetical protein